MKILIVTQYFWPENFRINELASSLKREGHEVKVLTGYPNYPEGVIYEDFLKNKNKYSTYDGIKIIRVPIIQRGKNNIQLILNYLSFVLSACSVGIFKLRKNKFDVVFVFQLSPVFVGIPSSIISFLKGCPQIFWVLDLWPEMLTLSSIEIFKNKWLQSFIRKIVQLIYSRCDVILAQSKSYQKEIKKYTNNKVLYFPAWVESEFKVAPKNLAKEITHKKDVFTIMFAGNIGKAQDFPSILKTVEYLLKENFNKFRIITIGEGSDKKWLINQIKENDLKNYFEILDKFPLERMPSFFAHADTLLVSLRGNHEVFKMTIPGKVQTYLASGIPILGMIDGEGALVIKESNAGYVCKAGDYKGLAKLIIKMSKLNKHNKLLLGNNGIRYCEEKFNKNALIDQLQSIIHEL